MIKESTLQPEQAIFRETVMAGDYFAVQAKRVPLPL